jgi:hypothetical protein
VDSLVSLISWLALGSPHRFAPNGNKTDTTSSGTYRRQADALEIKLTPSAERTPRGRETLGLRTLLGVLLLLIGCVSGAELRLQSITTAPITCDPMWQNFHSVQWQNTTGADIRIRRIEMQFVSAQSLVGEFALWFQQGWHPSEATPDGRSITALQGPLIDSFGVNVFSPPNRPLLKQTDFGVNYVTVPAGSWTTMTVNCGPSVVDGAYASTAFSYVAAVRFWYAVAP